VRIPIACYLVKTSDTTILFDTGLSPRAVPGLLRTDSLAAFTEADLLVNRLDSVGIEPENVDVVVLSHLPFRSRGGRLPLHEVRAGGPAGRVRVRSYPADSSPLLLQKNFDLPGYRWRLLDGDTEIVPGVTVLRSDGHTPGHQSLLIELPQTGR